MPTRGEWPLNPSPRRQRHGPGWPASPRSGRTPVGRGRRRRDEFRAGRGAVLSVTATIRGPRWFLPLLDRDAGRAVRPEPDVAPCQGGGLRAPQTAIGQHSDDCQVYGGPGLGDGHRFHVPPRPRRGSSPCSTSARSAWSPPGRSSSPRPSPVPSRPVGRTRPERTTRAVASVRGLGRRCRRPLAAGCTVEVAEYLTALAGDNAFESNVVALVVNSWETGVSSAPPGYVQRSEGRFCEPQFQPSPALPGLRAYAQDYLGAGIVPTPQPR